MSSAIVAESGKMDGTDLEDVWKTDLFQDGDQRDFLKDEVFDAGLLTTNWKNVFITKIGHHATIVPKLIEDYFWGTTKLVRLS